MIKTETLDIGMFIHETLKPFVATYPVVAEMGTQSPFAVYRRTATGVRDTKDRYNYEETVQMDITVTATAYPEAVEIAKTVKTALEGYRGRWRELYISRIELTGADEDWHSDAYIQRLLFNISIDKSVNTNQ